MTNYNQQPPRFIAYWLGYRSKDPHGKLTPALEAIPDYVDVVVLAFALVRTHNDIDPKFMFNPPNSASSIKTGVKALQARGKKVLLSVGGWGGNCWANVTDAGKLTTSIMALVNDWGLDGVDIDYEGDNTLQDWMTVPACPAPSGRNHTTMLDDLVLRLRDILGPRRYLTAVTVSGNQYISSALGQFNWIATMDYSGTYTYDNLAATYLQAYPKATFVPYVLGVISDPKQESVDYVEKLCAHKAPRGSLSMMLWDLSEDNPGFTHLPTWTYASKINQYLPR